ncbi:aldose 1-epimerase [Vogesella sp. LIG4]|uniref:aldose 1-epimerase n=1 Tax=Vogesella sp. LIG4 TaxID=1192162 RepID=UPI0008201DAA|nr:aldose 1-epimerase [Vogesella sp. LIG4]SCK08904.1 aldose 1-epimerase [Vogesella sp. LIG4]
MALLTLRHGPLHAELLPQAGGSIARCYLQTGAERLHLLRPASDADIEQGTVAGMACFPMLPLCGRLRDGRFHLPDGGQLSLPPAWRGDHFLHGTGWRRPWQLLAYGPAHATLQLRMEQGAEPYCFTASQHIVLDADGLTHTLSLRNEAAQTLPYGIGLHPYFPRHADTRLQTHIAGLWQADADILPLFPDAATPLVGALATGLHPDDWPLDNTAYGWGGTLRIYHAGLQLQLQASGPADLLTLYTPPGQDFFCLEPCTQLPDFPNLAAYPASQTGGHWLAPGQTLSMAMRLRPTLHAGDKP